MSRWGRVKRRTMMIVTSPGVVLIAGIGSAALIGIAPVVCAG